MPVAWRSASRSASPLRRGSRRVLAVAHGRPVLYTIADLGSLHRSATVGDFVVVGVAVLPSLATGWGTPWLSGSPSALEPRLPALGHAVLLRLRPHGGLAARTSGLPVGADPVDDPRSSSSSRLPGAGDRRVRCWRAAPCAAAPTESIAALPDARRRDRADDPRARPLREPRGPLRAAVDVQGVLLSLFIIDCALVVVPFVLSVGDQIETPDRSQRSATGCRTSSTAPRAWRSSAPTRLLPRSPSSTGRRALLGSTADEVLERVAECCTARGIAEKAAEPACRRVLRGRGRATAGSERHEVVAKDGEERSHSMSLTESSTTAVR